MTILTITVDVDAMHNYDMAFVDLVRLAAQMNVNVKANVNGLEVTARPGMTEADLTRDYDLSRRLANYPRS